MSETENIMPSKYEPKRLNRWLFETEGLDSFLVKKVNLPITTVENGKLKPLTKLELEVYDAISPSGSEEMIVVGNKASTPEGTVASVKILDAIGTVVSMWELKIKLDHMNFGDFDYAVHKPIVIKAVFDVLEMKLVY